MIVVFNIASFLQLFPEFKRVEAQLPGCFTIAGLYCDNGDNSRVHDIGARTTLLNLVTAHVAALTYGVDEDGASQLVGPVTMAKEGSAQVQVTLPKDITDYQLFWLSTKYGAMFWTASMGYRTFRFIPPPRGISTYVPRG